MRLGLLGLRSSAGPIRGALFVSLPCSAEATKGLRSTEEPSLTLTRQPAVFGEGTTYQSTVW
jgi:hypothetical protein